MIFGTCNRKRAKSFLDHPAYNYLTAGMKTFILDHLDETLKNGFRVMDPDVYSDPRLMTCNMEVFREMCRV